MSMRTGSPQTALQAVTWRRLLVSSWPWRSAGYLLTTLPVALAAFAGLAIALAGAGGPAVDGQLPGRHDRGPDPARGRADRRARAADRDAAGDGWSAGACAWSTPARPAPDRRIAAAAGPASWLRARYADPATWREVGYVCLLATVAPALTIAALLAALLTGTLIASPFLVLAQQPGSGPVALAFGQAATVGQALPYAIAGVAAAPAGSLPGDAAGRRARRGGAGAAARRAGEQLRAELIEVSRSRARLADAFEAERRRIERDLHDGAQQRLVSLTLQLGLARLDLPPGSPAAQTVDRRARAGQAADGRAARADPRHPAADPDRPRPARRARRARRPVRRSR